MARFFWYPIIVGISIHSVLSMRVHIELHDRTRRAASRVQACEWVGDAYCCVPVDLSLTPDGPTQYRFYADDALVIMAHDLEARPDSVIKVHTSPLAGCSGIPVLEYHVPPGDSYREWSTGALDNVISGVSFTFAGSTSAPMQFPDLVDFRGDDYIRAFDFPGIVYSKYGHPEVLIRGTPHHPLLGTFWSKQIFCFLFKLTRILLAHDRSLSANGTK